MDNEFNTAKAEFAKVIQKCIDMKWITVNEHISIDGVASQFANALTTMNVGKQEREVVGQLVWMKNFYPDNFRNILNLFNEK